MAPSNILSGVLLITVAAVMTPPVALATPEQTNAQSTSSLSDDTRLVDAIQRQDFEAARALLDAGGGRRCG